jgi:hypothetical protein
MRAQLPPIVKSAARVTAVIEEAVTRFPRRHRYTAGADLRQAARDVNRRAHYAWRERQAQLFRVRELAIAVDNLKLELQLAKDINAFVSFAQFEMIAELVSSLGRQIGGWLKALRNTGQNDRAVQPQGQRAQTLSSVPASQEAIP